MEVHPSFGLVHLLVLLSGSLLGLPPGDRDEALVRCAPKEALAYCEWSARGSGKEGQPGIDGLAADPEIRRFLGDVERALVSAAQEETQRASRQEAIAQSAAGPSAASGNAIILSKHLPALIHALMTRPGCFCLSLDPPPAAENAGSSPPTAAAVIGALKGALVINGGDQAEAIDQSLRGLLPLLPQSDKTTDLKKVSIHPPGLPFSLLLHRHNNYFILATGEPTLEQAVSGLEGKSKGLLENARFADAQQHAGDGKTACRTWVDVKTALSRTIGLLGPYGSFAEAIAKLVGVNEIDFVLSHTGVVDGQIRSTCFMGTSGKLSGILSLAAGRGIKAADLADVPADADLAAAVSLDLSKIYDEVERVITGTSFGAGTPFQDAVKRLEEKLDLSIKGDLLAAFGNVWTLSDSPSEGGLFVTSLVLGLEVRDEAKAKRVFGRLKDMISDNLHGRRDGLRRSGAVLEERNFLDQTIYFINTVGDDMPLAPAFCLTDKKLFIALEPQAIKAHLRFLHEKRAAFAPGVAAPALRDGGATIGFAMFDMPRLVRTLYAFAPYGSQMICSRLQQEGIPLDTFSFPSARAILPYAGPCSCVATRLEKGILIETRSFLPMPDSASVLLLFALIGDRQNTPLLRIR